MSDKSPLFVSSLELYIHATDLYALGNERKYKFIILHLANAAELLLKDQLIDQGKSIYHPKKTTTLAFWETLDSLQDSGVAVPERPILELLVDDRNTIQHRFGHPNSQTVYYYLEETTTFFTRFLLDQYGLAFAEVLDAYDLNEVALALLGKSAEKGEASETLDALFALSPEAAVIDVYNSIESKFAEVGGFDVPDGRRRFVTLSQVPGWRAVLADLATHDYIEQRTVAKYPLLRDMRNRAAHRAHSESDIPESRWHEALDVGKDLLAGLNKAATDGFFQKASDERSPQPPSDELD